MSKITLKLEISELLIFLVLILYYLSLLEEGTFACYLALLVVTKVPVRIQIVVMKI